MAFRFLGLALSGRFEETYALPLPARTERPLSSCRRTSAVPVTIIAGLFPGILIGLVATLGMSMPTLIFMAAVLLILVARPCS